MSVGWESRSQRLEQAGQDVITVTVGEQFSKLDRSAYAINPKTGMTITLNASNSGTG